MDSENTSMIRYNSSLYGFLTRILITTVATLIVAKLLSGIAVSGLWTAVGVAVVLAILDNLVRPIIMVIALPLTVMTLGLFIFFINAFIVLLASKIVGGFVVDGFGSALLFSILLTIINYLVAWPERHLGRGTYKLRNRQDNDHFDDYEDVTDSTPTEQ
ncbi:MAG: phage holin family protein [Bacteroidales bacterium]|nr:phage holin family protein [Bacteroidales bacterium]